MATCPACGQDLPDGSFRFCPHCGSALDAPESLSGKERKVVTVLFCDIVGFTAASERADPEDVAARIAPYHQRVRERLEAYGGTVEKFIGDAVMAVFGAPTAHEDDPERAVRAALSILEALDGDDPEPALSVRIGVNTGEAVVALGARPDLGETMVTGDVVNTAARIQAQAPVDGVAVGIGTHEATDRIFDYEPLEPLAAKGKSEPVPVWRALAARARFGSDVIRSMSTPLVGREVDFGLVRGAFDKAVAESSVQLVTLAGEPGVGKSRLVAELLAHIDGLEQLVRWRQGRCLPYGEGITFWALGEIVKAHAGVFESDSPAEVQAKLELTIPEGDDAAWLRNRLLPLLGVDPGTTSTREESFTAWRRFLESMAEDGPAVLVFEDLHWADEPLLAFLEHLADWAQGVPLLVVCTTRPELYERHPSWGAGLRSATTVSLSPLSDTDTARLVAHLLEQSVLPVETQSLLLERAGGNPLYAEEFVRMLRDRALIDERGALADGVEVTFPESIHALIAARLDTLDPDRKALLQDAAVLGKVFWSGAVAAMGERDAREVGQALHELTRKELIRPFRQSSMEGEQELGFWHALVRDVAYGQVPRAERALKHVRAARWLEERAGDRVEDVADVLAFHTGEAISLAEATGNTALAGELAPSLRRHATRAAERALALDTARALELAERALELTPEDDAGYAPLLSLWARAAFTAGELAPAADALERAIPLFLGREDVEGAAVALDQLGTVHYYMGDPRAVSEAERAVQLLEDRPPGPALVDTLSGLAGTYLVGDRLQETIAVANRALELAAELHLPEPLKALSFRGSARQLLGDEEGDADLGRACELLRTQGYGRDAVVAANNRAALIAESHGPRGSLPAMDEVMALARSRGVTLAGLRADRLIAVVEAGRLGEVLEEAPGIILEQEEKGFVMRWAYAEGQLARAHHETGALEQAERMADRAVARLGPSFQNIIVYEVLAAAAPILVDAGRPEEARECLSRAEKLVDSIGPDAATGAARVVACMLALGDVDLAVRLCERLEPQAAMHHAGLGHARALVQEHRGETREAAGALERVAEKWHELGAELQRAYAVLARGRCLATLGDPAAERTLLDARELFLAMGGTRGVVACDALLTTVARRSS